MTGRKRPPAPFTVAKAGGDKDSLPHASTCASTLFFPDYSSASIAKKKLRLANKSKVINLPSAGAPKIVLTNQNSEGGKNVTVLTSM